jgi:transposase-like protein
MDYPINQMDFEKQFKEEDQCLDLIFRLRWPEGYECEKCKNREYWKLSRGRISCRKCRNHTYILAGTLFHRSKKPLLIWFRAIWWMVGQKNGISALGLQKILGLGSYETAWAWLHKFRRIMVVPGRDLLSGDIEVDEIFIGGEQTGKRGRGAEGKVLVAVGVEVNEKRIGRIRLNIIKNAGYSSLEGFIKKNIEYGSRIITDGWKGYNGIEKNGYTRIMKRKTENIGEDPLPHVHTIASLLKRWLLGTHQGSASHKYLEFYLDEYTFRFNRRTSKSRGLLFIGSSFMKFLTIEHK